MYNFLSHLRARLQRDRHVRSASVQHTGRRISGLSGSNISICNGVVTVDGKIVEGVLTSADAPVVLHLDGTIDSLQCSESVTVHGGKVGTITALGSVSCDDVSGNVEASGSVSCDDVAGDVNAGGSVSCDDVGGDVCAGGSVRHG